MRNWVLIITLAVFYLFAGCDSGKNSPESLWSIADNPILSPWATEVDPAHPWPEYPRPDLQREEWLNLNGLWDYSITGSEQKPSEWEGKILVPYPVESALSGVKRKITEKEYLWYKRTFRIPRSWRRKDIILNFEASDWETTVWIDGKQAGRHRGGYDPFSFNITELTGRKKNHELLVRVWDPADEGTQPRGKQVAEPSGIWYTSTSGMWQTVWLEPVNKSFINSFRAVSDIETGSVIINTEVINPSSCKLKILILRDEKVLTSASGECTDQIRLTIPDFRLWTPDNPYLYDLRIEVIDDEEIKDAVNGHIGLRRVSIGKTSDGFNRILVNDRFIFQNGPLDQGFWPDGLYTPPTEKAMISDLYSIKDMGFNMLRKHVKIENRIFYHWCDKLGIMVWQDMPSGDRYISPDEPDIERSPESREQFEYELRNMIDTRYNHPSIIMWVPFNEGWGQYDTERITGMIKEYDSTRLVNSASGWTDRGTGDIYDIHHYPDPAAHATGDLRATVLGEFGGLGLPVPQHTWEKKNWGYRTMDDSLALLARYESYYDHIHRYVKENGLSACVYTQLTDVETETNGLITYDRKVNKMGPVNVRNANHNFIPPSLNSPVTIFTERFEVSLSNFREGGIIYYTTDGMEPSTTSEIFREPFTIEQNTVIKAFTRWDELVSRTATFKIMQVVPEMPADVSDLKQGLIASIYFGDFDSLPEFHNMKPSLRRIISEISHQTARRDDFFAVEFEGYMLIPASDVYGLSLASDDGSRLFLNGREILSNDGIHGMNEVSGYFPLGRGNHKLRLEYFQRQGGAGLKLLIEVPGHQKSNIPEPWLKH